MLARCTTSRQRVRIHCVAVPSVLYVINLQTLWAQIQQSMHMTSEASTLNWPFTSAGSSIQLVWRNLGPVEWSGSAASFPAAPREPGIYLIKVTLGDRYRIYIGEAEDLNRRLRRYGGRADEKPNQRGMTTTNMRARIRRTCRAGGGAVAYLLELPIRHLPEREALDPHCCADRVRPAREPAGGLADLWPRLHHPGTSAAEDHRDRLWLWQPLISSPG